MNKGTLDVHKIQTVTVEKAQAVLLKLIEAVSSNKRPVILKTAHGARVVVISEDVLLHSRLEVPYPEHVFHKLAAIPKKHRDLPCAEDDDL